MPKPKHLVDICCATFNHEDYIDSTIQGFLKQSTNFAFQILINDDASIDSTASIIKRYAQMYPDIIKPVFQSENQYSKGNYPIEHILFPKVTAKYVAICEGDDYWVDPNKLQMQVDILESDQSIALVHTDCDYMYESSSKLRQSVNNKSNIDYVSFESPFRGILSGNYAINTLTVLLRTSVLKTLLTRGIFDARRRQGDLPLWLAITQEYPISYIDKSTSTYRVRTESASKSKNIVKQIEFLLDSKLTRLEFAQKYSSDCKLIESLTDSYNHLLIRQAYHLANPEQAILAYSKLNSRLPLREFFQYSCLTNNYVRFFLGIPMLVKRWFLRLCAM